MINENDKKDPYGNNNADVLHDLTRIIHNSNSHLGMTEMYDRHLGAPRRKSQVRLASDNVIFSKILFVILSYTCPTPT